MVSEGVLYETLWYGRIGETPYEGTVLLLLVLQKRHQRLVPYSDAKLREGSNEGSVLLKIESVFIKPLVKEARNVRSDHLALFVVQIKHLRDSLQQTFLTGKPSEGE